MAFEIIVNDVNDCHRVAGFVHDHFDLSNSPLKIKITSTANRSMSQNAFIHVCFEEISRYLISRGRTDWTPEHVKDCLKFKFLGFEEKVYTDVLTGQKTSCNILKSTADLDKGEMYNFCTQVIQWAEGIGCMIAIPDYCEYYKLRSIQNE